MQPIENLDGTKTVYLCRYGSPSCYSQENDSQRSSHQRHVVVLKFEPSQPPRSFHCQGNISAHYTSNPLPSATLHQTCTFFFKRINNDDGRPSRKEYATSSSTSTCGATEDAGCLRASRGRLKCMNLETRWVWKLFFISVPGS